MSQVSYVGLIFDYLRENHPELSKQLGAELDDYVRGRIKELLPGEFETIEGYIREAKGNPFFDSMLSLQAQMKQSLESGEEIDLKSIIGGNPPPIPEDPQ